MREATCIWPARTVLGEGPVWIDPMARLYFVDIKGCAVLAFEASSGRRLVWSVGEEIGCIAPLPQGGFHAALRKSGFVHLHLEDDGTVLIDPIVHPEPELSSNRFNDGGVDPFGRFWCGSMDDAAVAPTGSFWQLDQDGALRRIDSGYVIANGPAFGPAGDAVYLTDSHARTIWHAPLNADGTIGPKAVFRRFASHEGTPDGMICDPAGGLWVALWGAGKVVCLDADGQITETVKVPTPLVTSCALAGTDHLYITSASIGLADPDERAGGLFVAVLGAQ